MNDIAPLMYWHYGTRLAAILVAGATIYLGYLLFIYGVTGKASLNVKSKTVQGQLLNAAPGLFFAVGGIATVISSVVVSPHATLGSDGSATFALKVSPLEETHSIDSIRYLGGVDNFRWEQLAELYSNVRRNPWSRGMVGPTCGIKNQEPVTLVPETNCAEVGEDNIVTWLDCKKQSDQARTTALAINMLRKKLSKGDEEEM